MLLKDVCTADVVCCGPQTTVLQAATLMRHRHVEDLSWSTIRRMKAYPRRGSPIAISWSRYWEMVSMRRMSPWELDAQRWSSLTSRRYDSGDRAQCTHMACAAAPVWHMRARWWE